ncbi:MAG: hypothetical protein IKJ78_01800 [Bacteroidales bacterium]|nr:hypothetical protein [Bacteroidales bacterium]
MKKIYIAMAAALMLVACGKENDGVAEQGYDSFVISVADLGGAGNAKAQWGSENPNGFYWEDGDKVLINGIEHTVHGSGNGPWSTEGVQVYSIDNGFFYVASYNGEANPDYKINEGRSYGPVNFDGGIPLACKGKTNKLTLYPCCAVLKVVNAGRDVATLFLSQPVPSAGTIDIASATVQVQGPDYYTDAFEEVQGSDGTVYFVLPMERGSISTTISIEDGDGNSKETPDEVTIQKGCLYEIDMLAE